MPNPIKYSTASQTGAIRIGNFWIGTDQDKGPTITTDYWNGITPATGGYAIYTNKGSDGPSITCPSNNTELVRFSGTLDTLKNFAVPLNNWVVRRSDIVEITDGSITPPNAGARVWSCTINTTTYANTLHRIWTYGNENGIVGTLGNYYYRYYLWVRGDAGNSACSISIDISDNAIVSTTVDNNTNWQLVSTIDRNVNYIADKFFDFGLNGANGTKYYISSIHIVSINSTTASGLVSLEDFPTPVYINYLSTIPLTFSSASQSLLYHNLKGRSVAVNKNYEPITSTNLILNLDATYTPSYPGIGTTWFDIGSSQSNATLTNGPIFNTNGFNFDGVNDYIAISSTMSISASSDWTIQAWVSSNATQSGSAYLSFIGGGGSFNYMYFEWRDRILFTNSAGTSFAFQTGFTPPLPLNNTPFLLTLIGRSGNLELYSNDVKTTVNVALGGDILFKYIMNQYAPGGKLFTFSLYSRALSASEVSQNYNAQKSNFLL